ncbi:hypothetical protein SCHIN_v1c00810 [Spiroplasma chinense]|uniref:Transmembrane protein n=1 Tax=Spiroplasma chinense TaxID=216932 RepID=A0A5B9Y3M7_9MOLU|nr:hypothetical protein [Spiroplasma chinense]QEH61279.1 hypothetical protein SCHIN_v1c00810 [Spiroplasma chinense]
MRKRREVVGSNYILLGWTALIWDLLVGFIGVALITRNWNDSLGKTEIVFLVLIVAGFVNAVTEKMQIYTYMNLHFEDKNYKYWIVMFSLVPIIGIFIWFCIMLEYSKTYENSKVYLEAKNSSVPLTILFLVFINVLLISCICITTFTVALNDYDKNIIFIAIIFGIVIGWMYLLTVVVSYFILKVTKPRESYDNEKIKVFKILAYIPLVSFVSSMVFIKKYYNNQYVENLVILKELSKKVV